MPRVAKVGKVRRASAWLRGGRACNGRPHLKAGLIWEDAFKVGDERARRRLALATPGDRRVWARHVRDMSEI